MDDKERRHLPQMMREQVVHARAVMCNSSSNSPVSLFLFPSDLKSQITDNGGQQTKTKFKSFSFPNGACGLWFRFLTI